MMTKQLMTDFNARQNYAWTYFFDKFYRPILLLANTIVQDWQEAEDIACKSFEKILFNEALVFDTPENLKSFLVLSARNEAYDLHRNKFRGRQMMCDQQAIESLEPIPYKRQPGDEDRLVQVKEQVQCLPAVMKEVILLRYFDGMKPADIAKQKKLSIQTINNQLNRGIRKLKELLGVPVD